MKCVVTEPFRIKTSQGERVLPPGQTIILPHDKATLLLQQGKIALSPEIQEAADKYAWCREVCMLTPGQAEHCERATPCLRFPVNRIINQNGEVKNG
jgi:hypothetical protein